MFVMNHYNEHIHVICMYELCTELLFVFSRCAVGCPLSGHYSLGITLFVLLFSVCVQYYSLMSVLSADQSWYIAVAAAIIRSAVCSL